MPLRILLAAFALTLLTAAAEMPEPAQIRDAAGAVARDLSVQTRLPNSSDAAEPSAAPRSQGWVQWGPEGPLVPAPAALLSLMHWVLLSVAAVAMVALLAILFHEPLESRFRPSLPRAGLAPDDPPAPPDPRELLARADELAAAGRYADAMHCVLLAAMALLGRDAAGQPADSLTSWELLRAAGLAPPRRDALRDLVTRVERAWFGLRPASLDDYRQARGSFDSFVSTPPELA